MLSIVRGVFSKKLKLCNGLEFHLPSRKVWATAQFLILEIFKKQRYYKENFGIEPTDTIVDIGANMGLFVMWAVPQAPKGKIIAVEPTDSIDVLSMNLDRNEIKNVRIIKAAAGADEQYINMVTYPGFNVINHHEEWKPTFLTRMLVYLLTRQKICKRVIQRVPTISLGRIIDDNDIDRIDLLKVDGEGCEFEIFRNLSDRHFRKIRKIIMEFHEYHPDNKSHELVSILKSKGFEVELDKPLFDYYIVGNCGFIWACRN